MATAKRRKPASRAAKRPQKGKGRGRKSKKSESLGWRRSPITGAVAVVVIIFCLYNLIFQGDVMSKYRADYVCRDCREVMRISYIKGNAPHTCPECSKQELYTALNCLECNEVTANLPPYRDFTCNACKYHEEVRLDPSQGPHPCPKCKQEAFFETYECINCDHVFGRDMTEFKERTFDDIDFEDEEFMLEEFFFDEFVATCPKCSKPEAYPLIQDPIATCEHCDSDKLKPITPVEVVKYELGRKLTDREKKKVEDWKAKNDK